MLNVTRHETGTAAANRDGMIRRDVAKSPFYTIALLSFRQATACLCSFVVEISCNNFLPPNHLSCFFVVPQPRVGRMPQMPVRRPLGELDLRNEPRLQPVTAFHLLSREAHIVRSLQQNPLGYEAARAAWRHFSTP